MSTSDVDYLTLGELKSLVSIRGETALQRQFGNNPVLVIRLADEAEQESLFHTPSAAMKRELGETDFADQDAGTAVMQEGGLRMKITRPSSRVLPITKSERNPFSGLVTVGRARNNDLRLRSNQVSKMHGWLRQEGEQWFFKDHDSTNGTIVNGEKLERGTECPLRSGDELSFGNIEALFLDRTGLHALCAMVGD